MQKRCEWCGNDPLYVDYHDNEWGLPIHDDQLLFEFLILEGAQAGLNWLTILKKRENYRKSFDAFDPQIVANYSQVDIDRLMADEGIVRNRLKIESAIKNAQGVLKIQKEFGSFDAYLWAYVDGTPIVNRWDSLEDIPVKTEISETMSKDLKKRGWSFVGPTTVYAFMQAMGLVNDHLEGCVVRERALTVRRSFVVPAGSS